MPEEGSEEARRKVEYYEDTAKILLEEGIHDVAVDFYTLAGMYSLLAGDEEGKRYVDKAIEICRNYGVSGHREVFANIGVQMFEGKHEGIEEEWNKIKGEYSEEEDQLVRELLERLREKAAKVEQVAAQVGEEWELIEGAGLQFESEGQVEQQIEEQVEQVAEGTFSEVEEGVKVEEEAGLEIAVIDPKNVYGRIRISEIAWRIGENTERIRQVLSALIERGKIAGKIKGDEYVQDEGISYHTFQVASKPQQAAEKPAFLSALKEKDVTAPARPGYKRCGVCGEEIPEAFMVCNHCGAHQ